MRNILFIGLLASLLAVSCDRTANSSSADESWMLAPRIFDAAGGVLPQVDSVRIVVRNANAPEASPFYAKSIDWHRHGDTIVGIPRNAALAVVVEGLKLQSDGSMAIWWSGSATSTFSGTQTLDAQTLPVPVVVGDTAAPKMGARTGDTAESADSTIRVVWRFTDASQVVAVVDGDTLHSVGDSVVWVRPWASGKSISVVASFRDQGGNLSRDSFGLVRRDAVAPPRFSVEPGIHDDIVRLTCSDSTPGARIEYSHDQGVNWAGCDGEIVLGSDTTILARASRTGWTASPIVTGRYRIRAGVPTFSVASGTSFDDLLVVRLSGSTKGAGYEISMDSAKTWTPYVDSIVLGRSLRLYARTIKDGLATSDTVSATYAVRAAVPIFSVSSGTSSDDLLVVKLSSTTKGAGFEISMDSSKTWTPYVDSIVLGRSLRLYARTVKGGLASSDTVSATYAVRAAAPTVDEQGVFNGYPTIHLQTATPAAEIRYTLDGTTPTSTSALYADSLVIDTTCELRAIAFKSGLAASGVLSADFQLVVDGTVQSSLTERILWYARKTKFLASTSIEVDFRCEIGGAAPTLGSPLCNDSVLVQPGDTIMVAVYSKIAPKVQPRTATFVFGTTWNEAVEYDTLVDDRDGQTYRTVVVGGKTWMAQNLNFEVDSSWCYADAADSCSKYGRLYSWPAAMDLASMNEDTLVGVGDSMRQGVCPTGWHLPSRAEWIELWTATGTNSSTSAHLRSVHGWSGEAADDPHGFRLLPAGQRARDQALSTPDYQMSGSYANHWTATEKASWSAYGMNIFLSNQIPDFYKYFGLSIRCVKD